MLIQTLELPKPRYASVGGQGQVYITARLNPLDWQRRQEEGQGLIRLIAGEPHFCVRCEDDQSNLCRRVLRQMLEQNRERLTECPECQDGVWDDWEDLEPCKSLGVRCGALTTALHTGFKGQKMRCRRSLGGKYCREAGGGGQEVVEGLLFRTTKCQTTQCQTTVGEAGSPRTARRLTILAPDQVVYEGNQIELICQANTNQSGEEKEDQSSPL